MNVDFKGFYEQNRLDLLTGGEVNFIIKENKLGSHEISDGYHTFAELYEFRKMYNALLFNEWALQGLNHVHKSLKHFDGEDCFGGGWFIVMADLPTGQISNHYKVEDWDLFDVPVTEKALLQYDGHTAADVLLRMKAYIDHD